MHLAGGLSRELPERQRCSKYSTHLNRLHCANKDNPVPPASTCLSPRWRSSCKDKPLWLVMTAARSRVQAGARIVPLVALLLPRRALFLIGASLPTGTYLLSAPVLQAVAAINLLGAVAVAAAKLAADSLAVAFLAVTVQAAASRAAATLAAIFRATAVLAPGLLAVSVLVAALLAAGLLASILAAALSAAVLLAAALLDAALLATTLLAASALLNLFSLTARLPGLLAGLLAGLLPGLVHSCILLIAGHLLRITMHHFRQLRRLPSNGPLVCCRPDAAAPRPAPGATQLPPFGSKANGLRKLLHWHRCWCW
mmetsp:Transcript_2774/g.8504  ORF Transcript_2774/g.8504 Transcript_2774/m.8504 type:complete len:312 (+) Transcript_2774:295-1230(+)